MKNTVFVQTNSASKAVQGYMNRVYQYMALGIGLTVATALFILTSPSLQMFILGTPLYYVFSFAPLGIALYIGTTMNRITSARAQMLFWVYAACFGVSLIPFMTAYTTRSLIQVFACSSMVFGGMSIFGYFTKRDLTPIGGFLIMALWGLIAVSLVGMFLRSSSLEFIISLAAVFIFSGITAYETQQLKEIFLRYRQANDEDINKIAIIGALNLYTSFLNLFIALLRLFGNRR